MVSTQNAMNQYPIIQHYYVGVNKNVIGTTRFKSLTHWLKNINLYINLNPNKIKN